MIASSPPLGGNGIHVCGIVDCQPSKEHSDQFPDRRHAQGFAVNLSAGEPRTVRMIYFLPNDRPYRTDVVQRMKDQIRTVQRFYADQMEMHGYGKVTFRVETDSQGEPIVHRVDGQHPDAHYLGYTEDAVLTEIGLAFNRDVNIYFIAIDNSVNGINYGDRVFGGFGRRWGKYGGHALVASQFGWELVAHELGHAFGLQHDFNDSTYVMSYGPGRTRLSPCHAEFLSVHPYFSSNTPIQGEGAATIELISSPRYPEGAARVSVQFKVSDIEGLHQAQLFVRTIKPHLSAGALELKAYRGLGDEKDVLIEFDYDGVIPSDERTSFSSSMVHPISFEVVDTDGDVGWTSFVLFSDALQPLSKVSGDNQHGLPNVPLPVPFGVELRDLSDGFVHEGVSVTFTVTAGDGTLSVERSETDYNGRAESTLTLGPNLETNTVEVSAAGNTVIFNAVAGAAMDIPDANLRAALGTALRGAPDNLIVSAEIATLTHFEVPYVGIRNLTGLEDATNLTGLDLAGNNISDISPIAGLTKLISLDLGKNSISDISAVIGLTNLTTLILNNNSISDISPLVENTGLAGEGTVDLQANPLSYPSIHTYIPALQSRGVTVRFDNRIPATPQKISGDNQQGAAGALLEQPFIVEVRDEAGIPFEGVPATFTVTAGGGLVQPETVLTDGNGRAESTLTLGSDGGTNTVHVSVEGISQPVTFTAVAEIEFNLSIPSGISLIHVPLKVTAVDGVAKTIESIADLYNALGGADTVNFLITYDSQAQEWHSYFGGSDTGTSADRALTDDIGIVAAMIAPVSIRLSGTPLGTNGTSTITLNPGFNLVGLPLRDSRVDRVSNLFALDGIGGNVPVIILTDNGEFKSVGRTGDPGDMEITGGQSFILIAQRAARVGISGDGWYNSLGMAAAPSVGNADLHSLLTGIQVTDTTPVLALRGSIVDEGVGVNKAGFRVTVKNLSTGRETTSVTGYDEAGYRITIVDIVTGRAAQIGDILEVSAHSPDPFLGVNPLRYTITAEDVRQSRIQLPALVAYEIPSETELLPNYPNPFNPETWIPYRQAEDAFVTLTIYNLSGQIVRTLEVGHRIAAAYESRSKAIYWDGRNKLGERMASGVYFYTLTAGDYSATRKMLILK